MIDGIHRDPHRRFFEAFAGTYFLEKFPVSTMIWSLAPDFVLLLLLVGRMYDQAPHGAES